MRVVLVVAILCVVVMVSTAHAGPAPVAIVDVEAPAINCIFDLDCTIVVTDTTDHFTLDGTVGDAFLQSRTFPPGEPGTVAEGLFGYEYRLDLRELVGVLHIPCITTFRIEFGSLIPLDYDDNGVLDDVFVVTRGGLGNVAPTSADRVGNTITFNFDPPVCAGGSPGNGESTFFFGLTSSLPPHAIVTQVRDTSGLEYTLDARAPSSELLDHFKCYPTPAGEPVNASVVLRDQFGEEEARVREAIRFCNPVEKTRLDPTGDEGVTPIQNPAAHLKFYRIETTNQAPIREVIVSNQFGQDQRLEVFDPLFLAVPTQKLRHQPPKGLDHFKCYKVEGQSIEAVVALRDQFHREPQVKVHNPFVLCNPVEKTHDDTVTPIQNPEAHLVCYQIEGRQIQGGVVVRNQFGIEILPLERADLLCVPSQKIMVSPESVPGEVQDDIVDIIRPLAAPPIFQGCLSPTHDFVVTGSETVVSGDEHCFPSNGDGTFGLRSDIPGLTRVDGMDVADMDGDRDNDFLACDGNTGEVYLYTQGPPGIFTPSVVATGVTSGSGGSIFCTYLREGDFDEDGQKDFIVGDNRVTNGMFVYLQGPAGTFTPVASGLDVSWASPSGDKCNCLFGVAVGDVDGDGHQDVLVLGYRGAGAGQMQFYQGDGAGGMAAPILKFNISADFPIVSAPTGLALFDLEGDGDLDIIVGGSADGSHYIYTNVGGGNFATPAGPAFDVNNYTGIDAYDFDGDSDDDLVLVDWATRRLLYVQNLGGGLAAPVLAGNVDGSSIGIGAPQRKPLDHFKCYPTQDNEPVDASVFLQDQFGEEDALVLEAIRFCNPVEKTRLDPTGKEGVTPIQNRDAHLKFYRIETATQAPVRQVIVSNQFGQDQRLEVFEPLFLAVPTQKLEPESHPPPRDLDHFKCYRVEGQPVEALVDLKDQFHREPEVKVHDPFVLCNPVQKIHDDVVTPIQNPGAHLMCYQIEGAPFETEVQTNNQFSEESFRVEQADLLCVPSRKFEPKPLDHFKCYPTEGVEPVDIPVSLRDQFGAEDARVQEAVRFCNPVEKTRLDPTTGDETVTPIQDPDAHLKFYRIKTETQAPPRQVLVSNQFGEEQSLEVLEPVFLAVPTQKLEPEPHPPPKGLDHFKCYEASGEPLSVGLALRDQFGFEPGVEVLDPFVLCNPVEKTHDDIVTPIQNPDDHLVCYKLEGTQFTATAQMRNQFGEEVLVVDPADLLCVPSQKIPLLQEPAIRTMCGDDWSVADFDGGLVLPGSPGTGLYRDNPDVTWPDGRPRRPCGEYVPINGPDQPLSGVKRFRVAYRQAGTPVPPVNTALGIETRWRLWRWDGNTNTCKLDPVPTLVTTPGNVSGGGWMDANDYLAAELDPFCPNAGLRLAVWDTNDKMGLGPLDENGILDTNGHYVVWLEWEDNNSVFHKEPLEHHLQLDNTLPVINDLQVKYEQDGEEVEVKACGDAPKGQTIFKVYGDFEDDYYWSYLTQVRGGDPPKTVTYGWHNYYDGTSEVANTDKTGTTPVNTTVFLRDIDMNDFGPSFTDCCYLLELFVRDAARRHSFNNVWANDNTGAFVSEFITFSAGP